MTAKGLVTRTEDQRAHVYSAEPARGENQAAVRGRRAASACSTAPPASSCSTPCPAAAARRKKSTRCAACSTNTKGNSHDTTTEFMHTLAWSLLHFLWQGAAIAAVAAAFMFVFRKPATRYLVGIAALALMLVSFGVTFALISGSAAAGAEFRLQGRRPPPRSHPREQLRTPQRFHWSEQAAVSSDGGFRLDRAQLAGSACSCSRCESHSDCWCSSTCAGAISSRCPTRLSIDSARCSAVSAFAASFVTASATRSSVPAVIGFFRPIVLLAHARADRPHARAARSRHRARARAHQAVRRRREFLPGHRRDRCSSFIPPCGGSTSASARIARIAVTTSPSPRAAAPWVTPVRSPPWRAGATCRVSPWPPPAAPWPRASRACSASAS